jgi:hypothetical protein
MTTFTKYILPSTLVFFGAIIGVVLTSYFNHNDWEERVNYERQSKIFEEKMKLIERTTSIFAKIPAADDYFTNYFRIKIDTTKNKLGDKTIETDLANKLADIRSELWTVLLLDQLYFGDSTKIKINNILGKSKEYYWWKIPEEKYNEIIQTMTSELETNTFTIKYQSNEEVGNKMSDTSKILWTAIATLIGGIIIYVIGRAIEKFVLEPLQEYKKTLANISDTLIFHANTYSNPSVSSPEDKLAASRAIRKLSSELNSKTHQIVFYKIFERMKVIPSYNNSMDAASTLMGFSNSVHRADFNEIERRSKRLEELLKIKI